MFLLWPVFIFCWATAGTIAGFVGLSQLGNLDPPELNCYIDYTAYEEYVPKANDALTDEEIQYKEEQAALAAAAVAAAGETAEGTSGGVTEGTTETLSTDTPVETNNEPKQEYERVIRTSNPELAGTVTSCDDLQS